MKRAYKFAGVMAAITIAAGVFALAGGYGCDKKKHPNVFLVIIDTLPAEHSSGYGYERSTTPNLDRLAEEGVRFENAVAPSPWTLPSITSILTGALPSRHQAGYHIDPPDKADRRMARMRSGMTTLGNLFQDHGYKTVGFFNNPFTHPEFGLNQGFDEYNYAGGDNMNIRTANLVVAQAQKWIEENGDEPFFMALHFFDPHLAYNPPLTSAAPYIADYQGNLSPPFNPELYEVRTGELELSDEDKKFVVGLFDAEVATVDAVLGSFVEYLKEKQLYDNALIIVTSDHGEEFWQHGGFEHGHSLHKEVIEVPLVMRYPGKLMAGKEVGEYVSLCDILPTVAEFLGWQVTFQHDGRSLYPRGGRINVPPHPVVSENMHYGPQKQGFYSEGLKLIVNVETGEMRVYDLEKDPDEMNNTLGSEKLPPRVKDQVAKIAKDLEALLKSGKPDAAMLDRDTIDKLKSLGYISGSAPPPPSPVKLPGSDSGEDASDGESPESPEGNAADGDTSGGGD